MAKVQLQKELTKQERDDIVAFLGSLTGKLPPSFAESPILPASGFLEPVTPGSTQKPK
jgi:cytochrome c peroxidase